jgi:hypothetical protein
MGFIYGIKVWIQKQPQVNDFGFHISWILDTAFAPWIQNPGTTLTCKMYLTFCLGGSTPQTFQ